ncbi:MULTISPECIES: DUF2442 domain-containing protein [Acidithiobacillus]|uniref:DUF2442 domain-containing protein n=2 Tax=Acidithiobacillus thiooxidans TaxID=930 RepID=A0A1C2J1B7_ACITH|nr:MULTISPECIES: DUF2442 domain-containing protein [Acidithiobacillus]MDD5278059.1 DUF2442 domain-containing protein [Acidithiobacillus sp.]MDX5935900.1 DUF2442 domain-containing protein [Acidithiobacillus thiooxidans]OCX70713.1 hypothetical protein A6P07_13600 [Acidithiobacillus thiooxidans]OCX72428.1 hypothetical protein A6O24_13995 [Acidithiobacillus thiooxidans]OCX82028.1 hypothetical protein A6O26_11210 [Acidithiobacillus thiooxidans]
MIRITEAKALPGHRLHVRFNTGQEGDVDLSREMTDPIFDALRDNDLFSRVEVHSWFQTVTWPNGADLAPEYLMDPLQRQQGDKT